MLLLKPKIIAGLILTGIIWANGLTAQSILTVRKTFDPDPFYSQGDTVEQNAAKNTLRWAIDSANKVTSSIINFDISGSGQHVITLNSNLPPITRQVTLDGTTQTGYQWHHPTIIIESQDSNGDGGIQYYFTSNCLIKGLHIRRLQENGIYIGFCDHITIQDNIITEIDSIEGNINCGIRLNSSEHCNIYGNLIGTDANNTNLGNYGIGIFIWGLTAGVPSDSNIIGGPGNKQNIIAYNGTPNDLNSNGIALVYCDHELITRNEIYDNQNKAIQLWGVGNHNKSKPIINTITDLSNVTGTSESGDSIELFGSTGAQNANEYLATVLTDVNGNWSADLSGSTWHYISATARDVDNNTSELAISNEFTDSTSCHCDPLRFCFPEIICAGEAVTVINGSEECPKGAEFIWDYGDNTSATDSMTHVFANPGDYTVTLSITTVEGCQPQSVSSEIHITDCSQPCINCIGSFSPDSGKYMVGAWVKEAGALLTSTSYSNPEIYFVFTDANGTNATVGPFKAKGNIIDGWQRIEEELDIPDNTTYVQIKLNSVSGDSYFDDIRVYPYDATVKSYVYDPINLRFVAELDERNYATFYEYDEEGKLIRVKKETERGIMTIKESKNSIQKR